jgi:hypothetical protein
MLRRQGAGGRRQGKKREAGGAGEEKRSRGSKEKTIYSFLTSHASPSPSSLSFLN